MIVLHENLYIDIFKEYLHKHYTELNDIDPVEINRIRFYTRAIYIACVITNSENKKNLSVDDAKNWMSKVISNECLFVNLINDADPKLIHIINNYTIPPFSGNIGALYERLLNVETTGHKVIKGKEHRNNLGSYYTPKNLADTLISKSIDLYTSNSTNNILNAKIVDFSCGAGIFLTGAIEYISSLFKYKGVDIENVRKQIACNIHACDVDPIALEVAIINILQYISDYSLYPILRRNFNHANFLVRSKEFSNAKVRLEIAKNGFIYHKALSFDMCDNQKYDIVLGNPPWEKIRFEEKSFYSQYLEQLNNINFKFQLPSLINQANSKINNYACLYKLQLESVKADIKRNNLFKDSCCGELNTCTLFADAAYNALSPNGVFGLVVKSSLVTSPINKVFFNKIKYNIDSIFDFINKEKLFDIDSRERFCLLIMNRTHHENITLGMNLQNVDEMSVNHTRISINNIKKLNPETGMLPNIESIKDINILLRIYNSFDVLRNSFKQIKFGRLVHLTNHIDDLDKEPKCDNIPVYEGKFFHLFDGSYSGFNDVNEADRYKNKASSKKLTDTQKQSGVYPLSRFYIQKQRWESLSKQYNAKYMLAWRSLTSASNTRTCIATVLPFMPASQSVQFLTTESNTDLIYLSSIFNSMTFDYIVKCKLNGIDLTQAILNQIPLPSISYANSIDISIEGYSQSAKSWLLQISHLLMSNDARLSQVYDAAEIVDDYLLKYSRVELFQLLDIVVCRLYGITLEELTHILTKFTKHYCKKNRDFILDSYKELLS